MGIRSTSRRLGRVVAVVLVVCWWPGARADEAAPETPAAQAEAPKPEAKRWIWSWKWDNGVRYHLEVPFENVWIGPDKGPLRNEEIEKRLAFVGTIGARFQVDAAGYASTRGLEDVDSGGELRRLRFGTRGDFYLLGHVSYALDVELIGSSFEVGDVYFWWKELPIIQRFKIGNFTPPMSLESLTSSRDTVFMETGLPVEAFGPARSSGIQIGGPVLDQRLTWAFASVRTLGTTDQGDKSKAGGRALGRITWLPEDDPEHARLTHVGVSASILFSAEDVRYETRPESHVAPSLVDTGKLRAANQSTASGIELLHIRGPWLFMGEGLGTRVSGNHDGTFWGADALAGYTLTGESQPYDRTSGILDQFVPARPFSWHDRTWGALRVAGRVSHVDLSQGPVAGGRETNLTADLTWFLNSWLLFKVEYGQAFVRSRPDAGNLHFGQARLQIDFY